jgi:hypothetical protein
VLVRLGHVMAVDHVPAVAHAGHAEQHVTGGVRGRVGEQAGQVSRGVRAHQMLVVDIAGVAPAAGDVVGTITKPVVVVGDRDDRRADVAANLDVGSEFPLECVDHELDGVRPMFGQRQVDGHSDLQRRWFGQKESPRHEAGGFHQRMCEISAAKRSHRSSGGAEIEPCTRS